jgi:hypothetical protein
MSTHKITVELMITAEDHHDAVTLARNIVQEGQERLDDPRALTRFDGLGEVTMEEIPQPKLRKFTATLVNSSAYEVEAASWRDAERMVKEILDNRTEKTLRDINYASSGWMISNIAES